MKDTLPSLVIAGVSGGVGKTLCTVGIVAALKQQGLNIAPFKKGPDFIDAAWLRLAAQVPCRNLDVFLNGEEQTQKTFIQSSNGTDIAVIEGNRGLYDGFDETGSYSTANLVKLLNTKVILVVNCTKITGTMAAIVKGCQVLDPDLNIGGVILNLVAGKRHQNIITNAIIKHTNLPIVGIIPKLKRISLFERHLGLLPPQEHMTAQKVIDEARKICGDHINLRQVKSLAENPPNPGHIKLMNKSLQSDNKDEVAIKKKKVVGIVDDAAFNFYYPENLEALEKCGAQIIKINALQDHELDKLDVLYIGGGFPETNANQLAANQKLLRAIKSAADNGLRIYAECGGLVYLGEKLKYQDKTYSLTGVFPISFHFSTKPRGHGYTVLKITKKNQFFPVGTVIKGHEFHYTYPEYNAGVHCVAEVMRGYGFDGCTDGLVYNNVFALYTHIHACSIKNWAQSILGKSP